MHHVLNSKYTTGLTAVVLAVSVVAIAQEPYFPEHAFFPDVEGLNGLVADLTSDQLRAMGEPSLWKFANANPDAEAYRFLWLAPRRHPTCFRLVREGDAITMHVSGHDGSPGSQVGRKTIDKHIKLDRDQWDRAVERIERSKFWDLPAEIVETRGIGDGDRIVIEGARKGKYHVIDRSGTTAGDRSLSFCRHMIDIAAEIGSLESWDQLRLNDKRSPDYRPEPSQTEDRG